MSTTFRDELQNPHYRCVRGLLNCLACYDNDYQRLNIEIKNIQREFKQSVDNVIFHCSEIRKLACASDERLAEFQRNVENINTTTKCFNERIDGIRKQRDTIVEDSKKCFEQFHIEKEKLKHFHEQTIRYLKEFAVQNRSPEDFRSCEKKLNETYTQFANEMSYIMKCERVLGPFFQLLHQCETQLCKFCSFNKYDWIPLGKSTKITDSFAKEIKLLMGTTLKKAFAQLHIHQPIDGNSFLAQYLINLELNEAIMKEKLEFYTTK